MRVCFTEISVSLSNVVAEGPHRWDIIMARRKARQSTSLARTSEFDRTTSGGPATYQARMYVIRIGISQEK